MAQGGCRTLRRGSAGGEVERGREREVRYMSQLLYEYSYIHSKITNKDSKENLNTRIIHSRFHRIIFCPASGSGLCMYKTRGIIVTVYDKGQTHSRKTRTRNPVPHPHACTPTRGMPHLATTHVGHTRCWPYHTRWAYHTHVGLQHVGLQHVGDGPARGEQAEGVVADGAAKNVVYLAAACLGSLGHVAEHVQRDLWGRGGGGWARGRKRFMLVCVVCVCV